MRQRSAGKPALNAFDLAFEGRLTADRNQLNKIELHRFLTDPCTPPVR
jgi:hypothetical protein